MPDTPVEEPTRTAGFVVLRFKDWHLFLSKLGEQTTIDLSVASSYQVVDISGAPVKIDQLTPGTLLEITWKGSKLETAIISRIVVKARGPGKTKR